MSKKIQNNIANSAEPDQTGKEQSDPCQHCLSKQA